MHIFPCVLYCMIRIAYLRILATMIGRITRQSGKYRKKIATLEILRKYQQCRNTYHWVYIILNILKFDMVVLIYQYQLIFKPPEKPKNIRLPK